MAILKQKLNCKNSSGTYDEIHLRTNTTNIVLSDSDSTLLSSKISSMDTAIAGKQAAGSYAAANHNHSGVYQPVGSYATTAQLNEVKTSVSNGKSAVASAITDKGVSTSATASFDTMASNIRAIPTAVGSTRVIWIDTPCITSNATVTATKGSVVITAYYNSTFGRWKAELPGNNYSGSWSIKGVYSGITKTATVSVNITTVDYYVQLGFIPLSGSLAVGNTVTFDNKSFLVVHNNGNQWYLANPVIVENTIFGSNNTYSGSTLASKCANWLSNFSANAQTFMNNITVNGVSAKVFIPSYEQVNGGFSYYNSNTNRLCQYNGTTTTWWTSSPYSGGYVYRVYTVGSITYGDPSASFGFRPHICIQV